MDTDSSKDVPKRPARNRRPAGEPDDFELDSILRDDIRLAIRLSLTPEKRKIKAKKMPGKLNLMPNINSCLPKKIMLEEPHSSSEVFEAKRKNKDTARSKIKFGKNREAPNLPKRVKPTNRNFSSEDEEKNEKNDSVIRSMSTICKINKILNKDSSLPADSCVEKCKEKKESDGTLTRKSLKILPPSRSFWFENLVLKA